MFPLVRRITAPSHKELVHISMTEMADYLKIKRLGVSIEEEPDELSIELDLSFNPEATDYVLLVVFNEKEEIIHVASES